MTQFHVLARRVAFAAAVACVFAGALSAWSTVGEARKPKSGSQPAAPSAQGPQGGDDASQKVAAAEAAKKAYDSGLKDFAGNRYQSSIEELSTAVKSGALTSSEMAKALITRGLAYKKTAKPGQAISDLTSAIWLKNGLSPSEQKSAIAERSEAYKMAGLQDTGSTPDQRAIGTPTVGSNVVANPGPGPNAGSAGLSAAAIAEAAGEQKVASSSGGGATSATVSNTTAPSAVTGGETTLQAAAGGSVSGGDAKPASSGIGSIFGWGQSSQPAAPAPAAPSSSPSMTSNVTGFFSNMFGGGSAAPAPEFQPDDRDGGDDIGSRGSPGDIELE